MISRRPQALVSLLYRSTLFSLLALCVAPRAALAEKVLTKIDNNWEVYTDGRVAGFASYVTGEGPPLTRMINGVQENINGGLWTLTPETQTGDGRGSVDMWRIRSGFLGNQLGLGVRGLVMPEVKVTGYVQIWAFIESDGRDKAQRNPADVRQGYAKVEGPFGTVTVGRTRTLVSRGATDINVMYGHRWGVGFPNQIDGRGPTQGMVGFGVLGSGFAAGIIYGTPTFAGLQLNLGVFDPATLGGPGWNGTKYPRAESELTFEQKFGDSGKVVLFANGAYQKVYKPSKCVPAADTVCEETVAGVGYGGRFELGPFRLGLAGHFGKGLGLAYALENSYAAGDAQTHLRKSDGYYAQTQVVVSDFDLFAGAGIARIFLTKLDSETPALSVIKYQMGINGGVVYNLSPNLHFDLEYFRAQAGWFLGETQTLHCFSGGMTFNW
jgi:hypothetical protein